ncbi:CobW family GTP-binding protein [Nocardia carnea]|uniref:CobW family GTP-binding protein n=1 Tax=Nocardia carnea TaxID=37328 RepID=UPI002457E84F|nr:GTP-binding protein [Nocardia carnea]
MAERIPVVIVAGFLGAGKTTLLNDLLHNHRGTRIGVVVNDFGAVNIDAMLVAGQVDAMVSVGSGCVCCAVDVTELDDLFTRLTDPRAGIDVIVVEASGLAEPRNLVRMVVGSENPRIRYGGLLEVVDAAEFSATRERHPELASHLRLADLVVLNKVDRLAPGELDRLRAEIATITEGAPVYATTRGRIDPGLLFDPRDPAAPRPGEQLSLDELLFDHDHHHDGDGHRHLHDEYTSTVFSSGTPVHPRRLVEFLEDPPPGLFRAKGFATFAVPGADRFVVHLVGRAITFEPVRGGRAPRTELVLIGTGLDTRAVLDRLGETVHAGPEPLTEQDLLGVWRYVPEEVTASSTVTEGM